MTDSSLREQTWRYQCVLVLGALTLSLACLGQGSFQPIQITFEGPPPQPPGTAVTVQEYHESGLSFTPIDPNASWAGFGRVGRNPTLAGLPDNGTAYLQALATDTLKFSLTTGAQFSLLGVDLAEYSTVVPDAVTVHFIGYRHNDSIVTADLTTDGIMDGTGPLADFQTFQFGPEFSGLDRVEIPTYGWSLDNMVVAIPEPAAGFLLLAGGVFGVTLRRWRHG